MASGKMNSLHAARYADFRYILIYVYDGTLI